MQVYLVGGAVRDQLLGKEVADKDYVVVGSSPEEMLALGYTAVGKSFPVFLHPKSKQEYALARIERKNGVGYTGFDCYFAKDVTLEQDLSRRDLTINAMAIDEHGQIYDPYQGQQDLNARKLRHVSDAFVEDPLRVLRVARFYATLAPFHFTIAAPTQALMTAMSASGELSSLPAERVWQEWQKALASDKPGHFVRALSDCQALFALTALTEDEARCIGQRLDLAAQTCPSLPWRLALGLGALATPHWQSLVQTLKVPREYCDALMIIDKLNQYQTEYAKPAQHRDSDAFFQLCQGVDAWRKSERLLTGLAHFCAFQMLPTPWLDRHRQALHAALSIDVQDIIATGVKGAAIKDALNQQRQQAIETALLSPR
ncbi:MULTISPECIES: multifunctional CCA tRNA nucleotidyl transferase/2'3'-cyclic phosphodiesterase/2'nucleotidase/phosphatase [unclassified Vibrio]|uniref:Multifunctional CCA tRNA nucleotidyl transferase/2'3'-cyclic phosphodiesterase/2'nucleotidase/phosphatase n=1 Tax=Vibrio sp. HB236076 TaxID=3232307 RepID=A0AB39HHQ3_9VIBR|nr:multifunctional CCA tRNA nucleotidyl transferase/2'3'-cyclic phosphodiesterase/2'nucleotidase/phosphatase [Vibrio sp. HB161653]MDP5254507.1 multifunctional CCA tRNA nucleotidyl transferase/2'3'-cyclic phosphodiesterase/2'nucleotidase/phosphatase [Vibrio sp. HB161653]